MKKNLIITLLLILSVFCFSACHKEVPPTADSEEGLEVTEGAGNAESDISDSAPEDLEDTSEYIDAIDDYRNVSGNTLPYIEGLDYEDADVEAYDNDIFITIEGDNEAFLKFKEAFNKTYGAPTYEDETQVNWTIENEDGVFTQILAIEGSKIHIDYYIPAV